MSSYKGERNEQVGTEDRSVPGGSIVGLRKRSIFIRPFFGNSKVEVVVRYGEAGPGPEGSVMTVAFQSAGQEFVALNGGPHFKFTEAISFVVNCGTQEELDELWEKLSEGERKLSAAG